MNLKDTIVKTLKVLAAVLTILVGAVLIVLALLLVRPVRERLFDVAVSRAQKAIPGEISLSEARWPSLGRLELGGALWIDGADTLASAGGLSVSADLSELFRKDIHIREVTASNIIADIPAITARLSTSEDTAESKKPKEDVKSSGGGFPRGGSVPGLPSIAVDRIEIDGQRILVSKGVDLIGLRLRCGLDLLHRSEPFISVEELSLDRRSSPVSADSLWLMANLAEPSLEGEGIILLPHGIDAHMICRTGQDGTFTVRIVPAKGPLTPTDAFVSINGRARAENRHIASIDCDIEFLSPGTDEMSSLPFLAGVLEGVGDLEGVRGGLKGHLDLTPDFAASTDIDLGRTSYLDTLHLAGTYSADRISVEGILLKMPGLAVDASGSLVGRSPELSAYIRVDSMAWANRIMPGLALPEDLAAELTVELGEGEERGAVPFRLMGHAAAGGTSIDSIDISGIIPADINRPYEADLMIDTQGIKIVTSAMADLSSGTKLRLAGPSVENADTGSVYITGDILIDDRTGKTTITDLHTDGALGRISVSAEIDSTRNGHFDILGRWPDPPAALRALVSADAVAWDSIAALWRADGPFEVLIDGMLSDGGRGISANGSARLPGPRLFTPVLPKGDVFGDLGPLLLDFGGSFTVGDSGSSIHGHADLDRTGWIDTALVSIKGSSKGIAVDSMLLSFEGLRIFAGGGIAGEVLNFDAAISLADSPLVKRLGRLAGRDLSMSLDARCTVTGKRDDPVVSIDLGGNVSTEGLVVPRFSGMTERAGGITEASLLMPEGFHTNVVTFDSLSVTYKDSDSADEHAGASVRLEATGKDAQILLAFRVPKGDRLSLLADTIHTSISGETLTSRAPFRISTLDGGGYSVDDLSLGGSIGSIRGDGIVSPDSADLEIFIEVDVPAKPDMIEVAERLWPDSMMINARMTGPSQVSAEGRISGITIGDGTGTVIDFGLISDENALRTSLIISGPVRKIYHIDGTFPPLRKNGSLADGPLQLDIVLDKVPVPGELKALVAEEPRMIGQLSGRIVARGTMSQPEAAVLLDCSFVGGEKLEQYLLSIDGGYALEELSDTTLKRLVRSRRAAGTRVAAAKRTAGLSAGLTLSKSGRPVLTGVLEYPMLITLVPFAFAIDESSDMLLEIVSDRLALTDIDPLLPPDIDLEGFTEIELKAEGEAGNPRFDGHLKTDGMSIAVATDLQASPTIDLEFGGDLSRPSVKGDIVVERALLRLPEIKESLHEFDGESILWEAADSFRMATDTTQSETEADTILLDEPEGFKGMDLDVTITIPNSFRVESEKLSLELEGILHIRQEGDRPIITGELKPRRGRLVFMGRYFDIQRGSVFFYGGDEMNPSFDLTLKARVAEYDISIKLTGTALEPEIELTSDPARSESDIMSLLLFGRSMSDLDGSQSNLLQQRTAEILMVYGASKLQSEMSGKLGIDLFTFQQSKRDPNETALMVGKYLNSKTMLKYEQGLENTANFLITLEYQLTRRFKFESFIDQKSETGLELNWSNEY
jgi:hypothetical protein